MNTVTDIESVDATAQKFAHDRPGFRLVDYAEVGLPIYRIRIQAVLLNHKKIPPIEEFILKALNSGLTSAEEISEFLGLELIIINAGLAELLRTDNISLSAPAGSRRQELALTKKGKSTLSEAELVMPEERTLEIEFDGLLRKPFFHSPVYPLKPRELKDNGMKEIPPFPTKRPEVENLDLQEVDNVIRQQDNVADEKKVLLAIKAIDYRQRFFMPAVALVYKAISGDEIQVAFVLDGRITENHERAFAQAGGPKKIGIEQSVNSVAQNQTDDIMEPEITSEIPPDKEVEKINKSVSDAQSELEDLKADLDDADNEEDKISVKEKIEEVSERLNQSKSELQAFPVRQLEVYDHPPLLHKAITDSQERLMIISPWIRSGVVNRKFVQEFEKMLKRGVRAYVGYGIAKEEDRNRYPSDIQAERDLKNLSEKYDNFSFVRFGDTHAKVLIMDNKFVVQSSFNWLSFRGDPNKTFRDEAGVYITIPEYIKELFDRYAPRFQEG